MSDELGGDPPDGERFERAIFWRALLIVALIGAVIAVRAIYG